MTGTPADSDLPVQKNINQYDGKITLETSEEDVSYTRNEWRTRRPVLGVACSQGPRQCGVPLVRGGGAGDDRD